MKKILKSCAAGFTALGGMLLALSACGDDITRVKIYNIYGLEIAKSAADFEKCDSASIGKMMFASDESMAYTCTDSGWVPLANAKGADGMDGASCTAEMLSDSSGYKIICGVDSVGVIFNGENGTKGNGCALTDDGKGTVMLVCGEDTVKVYKAVCGANAYDPASSFCQEGSLYSLCGGKNYNVTTEYCEDNSVYKIHGEFTDARDGRTYKTVKIGSQVWMAENLNYDYNVDYDYTEGPTLSWCHDIDTVQCNAQNHCNEPDSLSCIKYGRYYTWAAAMDSAAKFSDDGKDCGKGVFCSASGTVRGVCPEGFHLPDTTEWNAFAKFVADSLYGGKTDSVGYALKSIIGWKDGFNGSDVFGFEALPVGFGSISSEAIDRDSTYVSYWSSMEAKLEGSNGKDVAYYRYIQSLKSSTDPENFVSNWGEKKAARTVRCVKD